MELAERLQSSCGLRSEGFEGIAGRAALVLVGGALLTQPRCVLSLYRPVSSSALQYDSRTFCCPAVPEWRLPAYSSCFLSGGVCAIVAAHQIEAKIAPCTVPLSLAWADCVLTFHSGLPSESFVERSKTCVVT